MDYKEPLLTILMPHRNAHAGFFEEALGSVLAQTTGRWRLLVIDDGSDDPAALAALTRVSKWDDERIEVVRSRSRYVTGALNTGIESADTDFVCILHCDDLLAPQAVATLGRAIADHPTTDYFHSSRRFIDETGRPLSGVFEARSFADVRVFERSCPVKSLHCFRVSAARAIGGMDETLGLHGGDDYDFPWSMAEAGYSFLAVPDCLYAIRDHRVHYRLTTHVPLDVQAAELERILRKHGMSGRRVRKEVKVRRRTYLRQALFSSEEDRHTKESRGFDPGSSWRSSYELPEPGGFGSPITTGVTGDADPNSEDRPPPLARALHRTILRTGRGPLRIVWRGGYGLLIRAGAAYLRRGGQGTAVYVQGSFAAGEPVLGISDVDLALVVNSMSGRAVATERWARLCRRVPWLPKLIYATAYEEHELAEAAADTVLTSGLSAGEGGPATADRSLFYGGGAGNPKMSLRLRPGLGGPLRDWRLVAGPDRRPVLPAGDRQADLIAAWLELQHWWQHALLECTRPATFRPPYLAYLCVKLVAEPVRIWLWLAHGEQVSGRRRALERGLELLPDEEDAIRSAVTLYDSLSRDPPPSLAATLPAFVRLSARIAYLLEAETAQLAHTTVSLVGDPRELPLVERDFAEARALCPPGVEPRFLPLVDWRARAFPLAADEVLVLVPGDPAELDILAAAARVARPGFALGLRGPGMLVLPARGRAERPLSLAALRGIEFAGSDPVTFALEAGLVVAHFPEVRGWSALDSARRAVAEHRGWLEKAAMLDDASAIVIEKLFTAARAAVFLRSLSAGEAMLPLTAAAVARVLGDSRRDSVVADEALAAYWGSRIEGSCPQRETVEAFAELVRSLAPYRAAEVDPASAARRRSTTSSRIAS